MEPYDRTATQAFSAIKEGDSTAEAYAEALAARLNAGADLNALIAFDEQQVGPTTAGRAALRDKRPILNAPNAHNMS